MFNGEYLEAFSLKAGIGRSFSFSDDIQMDNFIESMNIQLEVMIEYSKVAGY